ncbi:unnamed protein product [Adineta ricciae]|uniref:3'-5' exonuclease domain-containing protein n=1 Tax=Adineta ricciae TaxID=249248 RepID=A0A815WAU0_ADIRI|nr:unnamed protein product [Adineta ricciae]
MMWSPNRTRFIKKEERNEILSTYPTFVPLNDYQIYFINESTDTNLLHNLIELTKNTKQFTIDTESDVLTYRPSLIQIEFINKTSTIILIEVCYLSKNEKSLISWLCRTIFTYIFQKSNIIYSWGDLNDELKKFLPYRLFTSNQLEKPTKINVQNEFREWHNGLVGFYAYGGENLWALQCAVASTYQQFLNKDRTLNIWSCSLDLSKNNNNSNSKILSMVQYAVNDCLAVTKLAYTMNEDISVE